MTNPEPPTTEWESHQYIVVFVSAIDGEWRVMQFDSFKKAKEYAAYGRKYEGVHPVVYRRTT